MKLPTLNLLILANENMNYIGFQFHNIYRDEHLLKLRITVCNGSFAGTADIYTDVNRLKEAVTKLQGFPSHLSDVRELNFGGFEHNSAGGGVNMRFYCADRAGRSYVDSSIQSEWNPSGKAQSAMLTVAVEPASIDVFVGELIRLSEDQTQSARLQGVVRQS